MLTFLASTTVPAPFSDALVTRALLLGRTGVATRPVSPLVLLVVILAVLAAIASIVSVCLAPDSFSACLDVRPARPDFYSTLKVQNLLPIPDLSLHE